MLAIRKTIRSHQNYQVYLCFSDFSNGSYDEEFRDTQDPDDFTLLSFGYFWWLVNIRSGYLLYYQEMTYYLESYLPNRFVRQFGYSQFYVSNRNLHLNYHENLFKGAWV